MFTCGGFVFLYGLVVGVRGSGLFVCTREGADSVRSGAEIVDGECVPAPFCAEGLAPVGGNSRMYFGLVGGNYVMCTSGLANASFGRYVGGCGGWWGISRRACEV